MKKLSYAILSAFTLMLVFEGGAALTTVQPIKTQKIRLAHQGYSFYVCYRPVKAYRIYRGRYGYKYRKYLGTKNVCATTHYPCHRYNAYQWGWYPTWKQAKNAGYQCSRRWH